MSNVSPQAGTPGAEDRPQVRLAWEGDVAWITLDRPERLNALAGRMRDELGEALAAVAERPQTRVLVLTGAGRAFCAGADLDAMAQVLAAADRATIAAFLRAGARVVRALRALPCPVVAALNGVAAGAGASLAVACDLRIAAESAGLGFGFTRIGLHPDWGATFFLPRLIGAGRAAELFFSGRVVGAAEAERIGLVERVVPDADFAEAAGAFAGALAAQPPLALAAVKRTLQRAFTDTLDDALAAEAAAQLRCFATTDVREGVAAFRERRAAVFHGH